MKRILLLCALTLTIPFHVARALTVSQLKTEIRLAIRDNPSDTARYRYSDTTLLNFLNEAQREIVTETGLSEKTTAYALRAFATYYDLPADFTTVEQVYFTDMGGKTIELAEVQQKTLYDKYPQWETQNGTPFEYWVSGSTNSSGQQSTPLRISYIPIPIRNSTGTVLVWYDSIMMDLANNADVPFENMRNLYPHHQALAYHVIFRIKLLEGKADEAGSYGVLLKNALDDLKMSLGNSPNYTPGMNTPSRSH